MSNEHITDEMIKDAIDSIDWSQMVTADDYPYMIARAAIALRPASQPVAVPDRVPMTDDEIQSAFLMWLGQDSWRVIGAYYMQGVRAAEAHHGITVPKATST